MPNYISESDNESYYDSEYDDSEYDELESITYEPEEPSSTKYNIVLYERYNELVHGISSESMKYHYLTQIRFKKLNSTLSNFLISSNLSNKIGIAECIYLPSQHCISILKTFWLRLIQRKWKNICKDRKDIIKKRCNPHALHYRTIHGTWPENCLNYPSLKGMLSNLF